MTELELEVAALEESAPEEVAGVALGEGLFTFDADGWRREPVAAFDAFLAQRRINGRVLRPSSFAIYRGMFLRLLDWLRYRGLALEDLRAGSLDDFLASRPLAPETRHRYLLVFTELYQHLLLLKDEEQANPARQLLTSQPAPDRQSPEALTPADVRRLLAQLSAEQLMPGWKHQRQAAMVMMLLGAGLRTTELLTLKLRSLSRGDSCWVPEHKPRPERVVPLHGMVREVVADWLALRERTGIAGELVFPSNTSGAPLTPSTLFRQVKALLKAADIERRYEGPMLLRNTCAVAWLSRHPTHKVQAWLGHELERTTEQLIAASEGWSQDNPLA